MNQAVLAALRGALDETGLLTGADIGERYYVDVLGNRGAPPVAVARPRSTEEVSRVLAIANDAGIAVVTQGGRTGLVIGCMPREGELVLSLERMNAIESIDVDAGTATVQAGVVLQALQDKLDPLGLSFPLDLGARGSCTIGGNVSTNAGGNRVVRYGMTRDLVLGLEAVLPDGTVLDGLKPFVKNNTGIDLKHLFIGGEGTMGVVTRLVLRLIPRAQSSAVALCALENFTQVRALLRHLRARLGGDMTAFEVMWHAYYSRVAKLAPGAAPLPDHHPFYVLTEAAGSAGGDFVERFESVLADAHEQGIIVDAVVAKSGAEAAKLWEMRDMSVEVGRTLAPEVSFDVSLRIADMEQFATDLAEVARGIDPRSADVIVFGHAADGNLHLVVHKPADRPELYRAITDGVYGLVRDYGGSVSAEHGIGTLRVPYLRHTRSEAEVAVMRALKRTLDPKNTLNPGRVTGQPG